MAAVLFCVSERNSGLLADAKHHGHVVSTVAPAGLRAALDRFKPHVLIVSAEPSHLTAVVLSECDSRGVRLVAVVSAEEGRRTVAELELFETVDAAASWSQIEAVLTASATAGSSATASAAASTETVSPELTLTDRPSSAGERSRGRVVAVWGPAGAPGRTTLAISVAAELVAAGHSVVLGDADTHAASIAPSLGLLDEAPGFAAACRLAGSESLTRTELERVAQQYRLVAGPLWVLTGIGRPSRWPELSADRVVATIRECREWVDFTVLDLAASIENDEEISSDLFVPRRNAASIACLREADIVLAVGSADPVGLSRFLRTHVDVLELASDARVIPVANKVRATAIGLNAASQVRQSLARFGGIDDAVLIPHDQSALDAALLSGRTLAEAAPRSPARAAVQQLVAQRVLAGAPARRQRATA